MVNPESACQLDLNRYRVVMDRETDRNTIANTRLAYSASRVKRARDRTTQHACSAMAYLQCLSCILLQLVDLSIHRLSSSFYIRSAHTFRPEYCVPRTTTKYGAPPTRCNYLFSRHGTSSQTSIQLRTLRRVAYVQKRIEGLILKKNTLN